MKYKNEVIIHLPKDKVAALYVDQDNLKHWQSGLQEITLISGKAGEEGAQTKLRFQMGKREIEMVETVVSNNIPDQYTTTYVTKGVHNIVKSSFEKVDDSTTKIITDNEFKFTTLMMKLIGFFMPGAFKKQSQQYLEQFKAFAEGKEN